ncbi:MAG: Mpo1-like protein [Thermoanaerobaculia bacterium]
MRSPSIETFQAFWPFYVSQHRRHGTRVLHFAGTTLALAWFAAAIATVQGFYVLYGLLCGYGFAWIGHFFIEKNRPATFTFPVWSFLGDFKMYGLMWRGRMTAEVERQGLAPAQ